MQRKGIVAACVLTALLFVCGQVQAAELTVSAAASLTNAFTELQARFMEKHKGDTVHTNFAASNPLLKQMLEGAPVDVFASADQETMDKAVAGSVVDPKSRKNFARNDLVLITKKGGKPLTNLNELTSLSRIAVGNPDSVPAGRYARDALRAAGLWEKVTPQLVFGNNVRQVLDYVARGEVDAGFVYKTDALHRAKDVVLGMTMTGHAPVLYPIAVATTGKNAAGGRVFLDFVCSPEGMAILAKYGFAKP